MKPTLFLMVLFSTLCSAQENPHGKFKEKDLTFTTPKAENIANTF